MTITETSAPPLPDTRQDRRWVWTAMDPEERSARVKELTQWVEWLVSEYEELRKEIPRCWYRHKGERNRLTALYVAWVRIYVEVGDSQRELALVDWHDALDRTVKALKFDSECVNTGEHNERQRERWSTDNRFEMWRDQGEMTQESFHPSPGYALKPKPTKR